jgi:RND superfamily putative drug exporter
VAVFASFLAAHVLELKQFGFGLSIAVLLDATAVRLLLVPAIMDIASRGNWWLPGVLDRRLRRESVRSRVAA